MVTVDLYIKSLNMSGFKIFNDESTFSSTVLSSMVYLITVRELGRPSLIMEMYLSIIK